MVTKDPTYRTRVVPTRRAFVDERNAGDYGTAFPPSPRLPALPSAISQTEGTWRYGKNACGDASFSGR